MKVAMYHHQSQGKGIFSKLLLIFIIVPLVEVYLLIKIGQYLGAWNTVLLIIITGFVGAILMRLEGWRVLTNFQHDLQHLQMPKDGLIDGLLILIGGIVLITPGLLTDLVGLTLLIPWTRHRVRNYIKKRLTKKFFDKSPIIDI